MAAIVRRPRKSGDSWAVVYRDQQRKQRWETSRSLSAAEARRDQIHDQLRYSRLTAGDLSDSISLRDYSGFWLTHVDVKPATRANYEWATRRHLVPRIGNVALRAISRLTVRHLLRDLREAGLARKSVCIIIGVLSSCLGEALDEGIILANPALSLGRIKKKLLPTQAESQMRVQPLSRQDLAALFQLARREAPNYWVLFEVLYYTGMRIGEAVALEWPDVDFVTRQIHIQRAMSLTTVSVPKNGRTRSIPMCDNLVRLLQAHDQRLREVWSTAGRPCPALVFPNVVGNHKDKNRTGRVFGSLLRRAGVASHHTLHDLRHTFATRLTEQGAPMTFVQHWLGHSTPQLTIGTYARFMKPQGFEYLKILEEGVPPGGEE